MGLASVLQPAVFFKIKSRIKINFKIFDMKTLVSSLSKQYNQKVSQLSSDFQLW